jgi:hypothetical protein
MVVTMDGRHFETIDLSKSLFQVLGFLTVDVSSPFYTVIENVDECDARGVCFSFMKDVEHDSERIPADLTVIDVSLDLDEPDISKMKSNDIDALLRVSIERELSCDEFDLIHWIGSEQHVVAGETMLMTGYVARVCGRERQIVAVRRRMSDRNICIIGTFDVRRTDDFMRPIMEMLGRVRAMVYHS